MVICTLHQPRAEIFQSFGKVLLLRPLSVDVAVDSNVVLCTPPKNCRNILLSSATSASSSSTYPRRSVVHSLTHSFTHSRVIRSTLKKKKPSKCGIHVVCTVVHVAYTVARVACTVARWLREAAENQCRVKAAAAFIHDRGGISKWTRHVACLDRRGLAGDDWDPSPLEAPGVAAAIPLALRRRRNLARPPPWRWNEDVSPPASTPPFPSPIVGTRR